VPHIDKDNAKTTQGHNSINEYATLYNTLIVFLHKFYLLCVLLTLTSLFSVVVFYSAFDLILLESASLLAVSRTGGIRDI
jgi:hypothetical protein